VALVEAMTFSNYVDHSARRPIGFPPAPELAVDVGC
jgi:hypothetical protein